MKVFLIVVSFLCLSVNVFVSVIVRSCGVIAALI